MTTENIKSWVIYYVFQDLVGSVKRSPDMAIGTIIAISKIPLQNSEKSRSTTFRNMNIDEEFTAHEETDC